MSNGREGSSATGGSAISKPAFGLLLLALATLLLAAVVLLPYMGSGQGLVKLRNALRFETADETSIRWSASSMPLTFTEEGRAAPLLFRDTATKVAGPAESDFGKALRLAGHLVISPERSGDAIQSSLEHTYREIVERGEGYCADYTAVFTGLALAAGIPVREWGMSFDGFGGNGHAFTEIYDQTLGKWVLIDAFYSFYVTDPAGMPLSVLELRDYLLQDRLEALTVMPIDPEQFMFPSFEYALRYYQRGADQVFMIWGNNVFSYDTNPGIRAARHISRSAEQLVGIAVGVQPRIMILSSPMNQSAVKELERLRLYLWIAFGAGVAVVVSLLVLLLTGIVRGSRKVRAQANTC